MGKKKERNNSADSDIPHKKSKHKHKKHKKRRERLSSASEEIDVVSIGDGKAKDEGKSMLKLKIKLGGHTLSTAEVIPMHSKDEIEEETALDYSNTEENLETEDPQTEEDYGFQDEEGTADESGFDQNFKPIEQDTNSIDSSFTQEEDIECSAVDTKVASGANEEDEEEKWLEALEKGELEEYTPPSKRKKDISLMTARQRALYGHNIEGETELMELPLWSKRRDDDSEEAQTRRKQRAKKRKQQMQKQIEDSKVQTINKLLNKQGVKNKKDERLANKKNNGEAHVRYLNNAGGIFLCYSEGLEFPLAKTEHMKKVHVPTQCAARGCKNIKKYSCSKTNLPICSLKCYKKVQVT